MAKHMERCSVCNKFVTLADKSDDGMCLSCALRLDELVDKATASYRRVIWFLICALVVLTFVGIMIVLPPIANAGDSQFVEEYYVTGTNVSTGERIVGWLDGKLGESEVSGYVLDRGEHYAVVGIANGMGSFELRSLCCVYDVVVTDEITNDKVVNRKQWQESWK